MSNTRTYTTVVTNTTFQGESRLSSVDLNNRPIKDKDMEEAFLSCIRLETLRQMSSVKNLDHAFYNCTSLQNVPNIPAACTTMEGTFQNCVNLNTYISIPDNVTNVTDCFNGCKRLDKAPSFSLSSSITSAIRTFKNTAIKNDIYLPSGVVDMTEAYNGCRYMLRSTHLPSSVQILEKTFYNCSNLNLIGEIPESVTNMKECFYNCDSLYGKIVINSKNITDATNCFFLPNSVVKDRNVYIPFEDNGTTTATYKAFTNAGYSSLERKDGVLLIPIDHRFVKIKLKGDGKTIEDVHAATVKVNGTVCRTMLDTHENKICISGCEDDVFYALVKKNTTYTVTVTLNEFNDYSHSYTMGDVDQNITATLTPTAPTKHTLTVTGTPSVTGTVVTMYLIEGNKSTIIGSAVSGHDYQKQYVHEVGSTLTIKVECSGTNYVTKYETFTWNTNQDLTKEINLEYRPDYTKGQVLYESNTAGQQGNLNLYNGYIYELTCVGGGGGSSYGFGGAGSAYRCKLYVTENNSISMTTGGGGQGGEWRPRNHCGYEGNQSIITGSRLGSIICKGGQAGVAARSYHCSHVNGYNHSASLVPITSLRFASETLLSNALQQRRESWISGTNYGMGGNGGYSKHDTGEWGKTGYIKVRYLDAMPVDVEPTDEDYDGNYTALVRQETSGTGTINLSAGLYRITLVGGGGGAVFFRSPTDTDMYYKATGGSGSVFKATVYLAAGNYRWTCGAAGKSCEASSNSSFTDGGDSSLYLEGAAEENRKLFAYGGKRGNVNAGTYTGGNGGAAPKVSETCYEMVIKRNGNKGSANTSTSTTLVGGESVFKEYGKGGYITNGTAKKGSDGYVKIVPLT